jgi:hypothetical protein
LVRPARRPLAARLALATALSAWSGPSLARADDVTAPSDAGAALGREGAEALAKGDYDAARLAFAQAYAVDPQPATLLRLAVAETKGGHPLDAIAHVRRWLQASPAQAAPGDREAAEALLAEDAAKVGHVRVEAPAGAQISMDAGAPVGIAPLSAPLDVAPGRHVLAARLGSASASTVIAPGPGETVVWQIQFERVAPAQAPPPSPAVGAMPRPALAVIPPARPPRKPRVTIRWGVSASLFVGGLASLAIGGGFLVASSDENSKWAVLDQVTGYCPQPPSTSQCAQLKTAADLRAENQNVAVGFGVAGGALIVAGVTTFIFWPAPRGDAPRVDLAPLLAPGVAGLRWAGQF